jgi:SulP family sulfate permease
MSQRQAEALSRQGSRRLGAAALLREALPITSWRNGVDFRHELFAGIVGALLVIPQAITFAYLAGVPPEYGLYCAIFVGFLSSLFGSSALVGGPNTAVSILLGLTVIPFAGRGSPLFIEFVLVLSLMVGAIQLIIWLVRGAELFRYFSPAAIAAIKVGVGLLLITSAVEGALGMGPLFTHFSYEKFYLAAVSWHDVVNLYAVSVSAVTVASGLVLRRQWARAYIVLAMLVGSAIGAGIYAVLGPVASELELLGHVRLSALPLTIPTLGPAQVLFLEQTFVSAAAIAVLGLAQTLVIARDLKATIDGDVDLNKETFAQGLANALAPFFSSFAGSGSFNRTSVAVEMGARTPLAGMIAAIAVVLITWVLGPLLTWLPMPVIAGVMVLVGIGMIQNNDFRMLRHRVEGAVFLVTLSAVIFLGLEVGILVAVIASVGFFVAAVSTVKLAISRRGDKEHVTVSGNLFYASLDPLAKHLRSNPAGNTVLDLRKVAYCDAAAQKLMERIQAERAKNGGRLEIVSVT